MEWPLDVIVALQDAVGPAAGRWAGNVLGASLGGGSGLQHLQVQG